MKAEEAEKCRDLRAMDGLVLGVDPTEEGHRSVVVGIIDPLHGGQLDGLVTNDTASRGIGTDGLQDCRECREANSNRHRGLGKLQMLPLEQVPCTNAHHEE